MVIRHLGTDVPMQAGRDVYYDELPADPDPVDVADTESNDALTIVYTSGTTGRPKGIVHSHGGFAAKTAVDFATASTCTPTTWSPGSPTSAGSWARCS